MENLANSTGLFSMYLLLAGYRGLQYKNQLVALLWDKVLSFTVLVVGAGMMVGPLFFTGNPNVVLLVFGAIAVVFGLRGL